MAHPLVDALIFFVVFVLCMALAAVFTQPVLVLVGGVCLVIGCLFVYHHFN